MPGFDLAPGDCAIAVPVQPDGVLQVAQRDVPAAHDPLLPDNQAEIAVAGLVRAGRRRQQHRQRRQTNHEQAHHQDVSRELIGERLDPDVLQARALEPIEHRLCGRGLARGDRRFEQNTRIRGLALRRPVPARELERLAWPVEQMQGEARLFSKVHAVAAAARRIEAGLQQRDVLAERRGVEPSLGQSQPEQQRVDPALVLEQLDDLVRPILVEKEVGVGAQQIRIARERQRSAKVPLGRSN